MKKVEFIETLDEASVDLLVLCDPTLQQRLDIELKGMISFNLERFDFPVALTTNGAHATPKIVVAKEGQNLAPLCSEKRVAIASIYKPVEKIAFEMLLEGVKADTLFFLCQNAKEKREAFQSYRALLEGIASAKEMISAPSNLMTPAKCAEKCQELEKQGVLVKVFDEKALKEIGAEALLAVGQGSSHPPKMVVMEWQGSKDQPICLVGKGICFDAGGINLKTISLTEMKWDKAGAGVIYGVMDTLSKIKAPIHVIGVLLFAENMPDGAALKPGDVIDTLGGKKVEIIDTDCEGRLVLADGLSFAQKNYSPKALIDLGTLTLETFGALGGEYAGLFCNDATLSEALIVAGIQSHEKLWPLPLGEYYANQLRSSIADLKNVGVFRYGASSAAAEFLRAFVSPQIPWAHLDISGVSWKIDSPKPEVTAFGVSLLINYFKNLNARNV